MLAGALFAGCTDEPEPEEASTDEAFAPVPPLEFELIDEHGRSFSATALRSDTTVLLFVFTDCPDIRPLAPFKVSAALFARDENLSVNVVSVGPWPDTPAAPRGFLASRDVTRPHPTEPLAANATPAVLIPLLTRAGVAIDIPGTTTGPGSSASPDDWDCVVDHGASVLLIDPDGVPVSALRDLNRGEPALIHDIELLASRL